MHSAITDHSNTAPDNWQSAIADKHHETLTQQQLVHKLLKQCYYFERGEKGFKIILRHTTAAMIAWQDLLASRADFKLEKLITAIDYPITTSDFEVLDTISKIRKNPKQHEDAHILLALYLYLADEVSIYPKGRTFLEACRNVGFLDKFNTKTGEEKLIEALKILGLYDMPHITNLVSQWRDYGSFGVESLPANDTPTDTFCKNNYSGVYALLAVTLCDKYSPLMRTQNCISYALAVRTEADKYEDVEERKKFIFDTASDCSKNINLTNKYVAKGHKIRFERLEQAIETALPEEDIRTKITEDRLKRDNDFFTNLFSSLPTETLEILYYSRYSLAFTEEHDLSITYPEGHIPGLSDKNTQKSREGRGDHLSRYRMIMFAQNPQALIHETWHLVAGVNCAENHHHYFDNLRNRKRVLTAKCYNVCKEVLQSNNPLLQTPAASYQGGTLYVILDCVTRYANYATEEDRCEDVLANILGLIYTEFPQSRKESNPFFRGENPIPELEPLYDMVEKLQTLYRDAAPLLKENFHKRLEYLNLSRFPSRAA